MGWRSQSVWLFLLCVGCAAPVTVEVHLDAEGVQPDRGLEPQVQLGEQTFRTQGLLDKLLGSLQQRYPQQDFPHVDWRKTLPRPGFLRRADLRITDIRLAETDQSLMDTTSVAAIEPDFKGKTVNLLIKGKFEANRKALPLADFAFSMASPLFLTSIAPEKDEPASRVVLDDAILLSTESISATEIRVSLDTRAIPDLYLKGWHKLTLVHGNYFTDALIRIGQPVPPEQSLQPLISAIEVVRNTRNEPRYLKVTGQNLMLQPLFSYSTVDQTFVFSDRTTVSETNGQLTWETLTLIPDPKTFDQRARHTLAYATPFGTVLKNF